jgi:hypothetical protein
MPVIKFACYKCAKEIEVQDRVGRRDECSNCKSDLHSCTNCEHYDVKAYNSCKEPAADVVKEKDRSNFCDYYTPNTKAAGGKPASKDDLLAAAEALFKKK